VPSCPGTDASPKETDAIIPNGVQAASLTLPAVEATRQTVDIEQGNVYRPVLEQSESSVS